MKGGESRTHTEANSRGNYVMLGRAGFGSLTHLAPADGLGDYVTPLDPHLIRRIIVNGGTGGSLRFHLYKRAVEEAFIQVRGLKGRYPVVE